MARNCLAAKNTADAAKLQPVKKEKSRKALDFQRFPGGRKPGVFPNSPKAMPCFAAPERGETCQIMHKPQTYAARSVIKFFWFLFFQEKERPPGEGKQRHNWEHAENRLFLIPRQWC
ncbi:MAG: hypothetical protein IJT94_11275 [Oscillibacter sp.]|nr:hypothetical protein [Oscillibacter sp.]